MEIVIHPENIFSAGFSITRRYRLFGSWSPTGNTGEKWKIKIAPTMAGIEFRLVMRTYRDDVTSFRVTYTNPHKHKRTEVYDSERNIYKNESTAIPETIEHQPFIYEKGGRVEIEALGTQQEVLGKLSLHLI